MQRGLPLLRSRPFVNKRGTPIQWLLSLLSAMFLIQGAVVSWGAIKFAMSLRPNLLIDERTL